MEFRIDKIARLKFLVNYLLNQCKKKNVHIILLQGDLGMGKTTLTQYLGNSLEVTERINSPTFVISKRYKIKGKKFGSIVHYDLYRLSNTKELEDIGILQEVLNPKNLVVVEWPELIIKKLKKYILVKLYFNNGKRVAKVLFKG